jgi:hypothetical protein
MKKNISLLLLSCTLFCSCNKVKELTQVEQDISYTQTLDASQFPDSLHYPYIPPGGVKVIFPEVAINTNSQQYIQDNNTAVNKINSVKLKSIVLQMIQPQGKNLDFLSTASFSIRADTLPSIMIVNAYSIPHNQRNVTLTGTTADLTKYFLQEKLYFLVTATFDSIPPPGTQINAITTFHLSANPLN